MAGKSIKKVLILRTDYYGAIRDGGVSTLYKGEVNSFIKKGIECIYIAGGCNYLTSRCSYYSVKHNRFLLNLPEIYNLPFTHKAYKQTKKVIKLQAPDFFIQYHSIMNYSGTLLKRKIDIPFVLHVDGVEFWAKQNWGRRLFLKPHLKWTELIQWKNADLINVPSQKIGEMLIELGVDPIKILVNPNAVDTDNFNPKIDSYTIKKNLNIEGKFTIGFFGSFGKWHGAEILAESIPYLIKRIDNPFILFVGDGILRPKVENIINNHHLGNLTKITGMLSYNVMPEYMAACDILTTPCVSDPNVGFFNSPIKLFEYMAMGKPIVATNVGQQAEVIIDGYNGILCEERSPEALAEAIIKLYENPELREKCAINARKDAVEKHSWDNHTQRILDAVEKLL